ncbi:unnamed protein product [Prunus armeniaca]
MNGLRIIQGEQSSPEPLSPRTAAVCAGLRRNYSSSSTESKSYESEGSSKMAVIPNNNNNVEGGGALVVQPRKPLLDRFELKSGMIHLLPTYYGNTTEDPYMHIKQFFEICATIKIQGLDDEQTKMRLFPFSLKDKAKSWLYSLPNASIHTWEELSNKFLQKFFPAQKTNKIRKEILGFTQKEGEAFHECWERYKEMISSCPHHNIESWMQMQSFYEGLLDSERMMVNATSEEGLMNKAADEAFTLFESLSANSQQWSHNKGRGAPMKAVVSEAVIDPLRNKVEVQDQSFAEHMLEQANALQARNPNNDPYSNTGAITQMCNNLKDLPQDFKYNKGNIVMFPKFWTQSDIDWSMKWDNLGSYEVRSEVDWLVHMKIILKWSGRCIAKFYPLDFTQTPPNNSSHHITMFPKFWTQSDIDWSMKLNNSSSYKVRSEVE